MTFLPIVERELRVRARQPATFWVRFGTALIGLCICGLQFQGAVDPSELGGTIFSSLVATAFLGCAVAFLLTADLISEERRENTLGLLFLTRVKAFDVLVGKTVSGGLTAVLALTGFLPVLMLPVLLGGVAPGEALRKGLVLLVLLVAGIVAGIWASSRTADWLKSLGLAAVVVLFTFVPLAAGAMVAATEYRGAGVASYWFLLGLQALVAAWQFAFARRSLHRAVTESEEPVQIETPSWNAVIRRRAPLADHVNPIEWSVRHERGVLVAFWTASGISLLVKSVGLLFQSMEAGNVSYVAPALLWTLWLLSIAGGFLSTALQAWAASRFILAARRTGELEVILTTPLGAGDFITGHWRALRARIRAPVMVSLIPVIFHAAIVLADGFIDKRSGVNWTVLMHDLWNIILTWIEVVAICWVGMWFGLRASRPASAVAMTVGVINGLPFAVTMFGWMALTFVARDGAGEALITGFRFATYLLSSGFLIGLVFWARRRLQTELAGVKRVHFGARSDWQDLREAWQRRRGTAPSPS